MPFQQQRPQKPPKVDLPTAIANNPYFIGPGGVMRGSRNWETGVSEYFARTNPALARQLADPSAPPPPASYAPFGATPEPTTEERVLLGPARARAGQDVDTSLMESYANARRTESATNARMFEQDLTANEERQKFNDRATASAPGSASETVPGLAPGAQTPTPAPARGPGLSAYSPAPPEAAGYGGYSDLLPERKPTIGAY